MTTTEDLERIALMHATLALREHAQRPAGPRSAATLARPAGPRVAPRHDPAHRTPQRVHAGCVRTL